MSSADLAPKKQLIFVTDPMCSWCWGMTADFERARDLLKDEVQFDLMLGGINTHGTQPIGDYGRRFLMRLWREVEATTGQTFGYVLPESYVHNSVSCCLAIEAVRECLESPPFEFLAELQRLFFTEGVDITSFERLKEVAAGFGVSGDEFDQHVHAPRTLEKIRFQFNHAQSFGTQALPSLLIADQESKMSLLAGGYVDAEMLQTLLRSTQQ